MKKEVFGLVLASIAGTSLADAAKEYHYTLISPPAYTSDWQAYIEMRAEQRPDVEFRLVNAADIYAAYPFDPAASEGEVRNPAESIHKWIRNQMNGITNADERKKYYFVLGGSWADAQAITSIEDARLQTKIPNVFTQPRKAGSVNLANDDPEHPVSDMFYACLDVKEGKWPWDSNGNGKYVDSGELGNDANDFYADVIIARIPIEKHPSATPKEVIAAFKAKVARVESDDFGGTYHFASAGGQVRTTYNITNGRTMREEREFYDGGINMFDPRHGGKWIDAEELPRNTVKNMIAPRRPILEGNPLFVYGWGADHATIEEAAAHYFAHDREAVEYRDHGSAADLYCKYINVNNYLKASGITKIVFSGFSCMTGHIDGGGMTLAEAEIESLNGGTVASVHNSRYGFGTNNVSIDDDGLSSSLQYYMKQGVFEKDMDIGSAWLDARQRYCGNTGTTARFCMVEQILYGDPLMKISIAIPETTLNETEIAVDEDTGYTTLNVKGGTSITGDNIFKVMTKLNVTDGSTLRFAANGGVGGEGVNFAGGSGVLTVASPTKAYMIQPTGASEVALAGNGTTLDFDTAAPKFSTLTLVGEGNTMCEGNILRGRTEGQLKDFLPLAVENTCVALGTVNAFKDANLESGFATVENGGLGITFNPNYGLANCWEYFSGSIALDNGTLYVDRTTTAGFGRPDGSGLEVGVSGDSSVETVNGGKATLFGTTTFTLENEANLVFNASMVADETTEGKIVIEGGSTSVETDISIAGEVTVNSGTLILNEIPLRNVTKLTIDGNSKLVIPPSAEGFYNILSMSGAVLDLEEGAQVFELGGDTPVEGRATSGAFFDISKFIVWNQASGDWTDTQSGNGKYYFPDIENAEEVTVNLPNALSCAFVAFGNQHSVYRFTGEPLTIGSAALSEDVIFENEVNAPNGMMVSGGDVALNSVSVPRLDIQNGAVFAADEIINKIETIKGVRFYPIRTNSDGNIVSILELRFNTSAGSLLPKGASANLKVSYPSSLGSVSNEGYLRDGDASGLSGSFTGSDSHCTITANDSDILSKEQFYLEYVFSEPQPMPTSYGLAASAATSPHNTESLTDFRVDVSPDGVNWVTVSRVSGRAVPAAGTGEMWYGNSSTAFGLAFSKAEVLVAEEGTLVAQGNATANITLAADSILKATDGKSLTLASGSKVTLPDTGKVKIDANGLDSENRAPIEVIKGVVFTQDDLAKFEVVGRSRRLVLSENGELQLVRFNRAPMITVR